MSRELEGLLQGAVGEPLTVANEFAEVQVRRVDTRNGSRLLITAPRTGQWISLDALEVEALTRQNTRTLTAMVGNSYGPLLPDEDERTMTDWLHGKRALIVGGGSGIGRAVVDAFRAEGARITVLERDRGKCDKLRGELPGVPVVEGDAITREANEHAVKVAVDSYGGLDTLVNCVGVFDFYQGVNDIKADDLATAFDEMFRTNVLSHLQSVKAAVPWLRAGTGSSIVLTESASSYYPGRGGVLYVVVEVRRARAGGRAGARAGAADSGQRGGAGRHAQHRSARPCQPGARRRPPRRHAQPGPRHGCAHPAQRRAHRRRPRVGFRVPGLRPVPRHHRRDHPPRRRIRYRHNESRAPMTDRLDQQRALVAQGCRVAAARGLVDGILGHLSLRVDDDHLLIRCRSDTDAGVAFTRPSDIRLIGFDGSAGADGELDGYRVPNELPIHVETMLANPDHRAVAHLHPPAVVAADLAGHRDPADLRRLRHSRRLARAPRRARLRARRADPKLRAGQGNGGGDARWAGGDLPWTRNHQRRAQYSAGGAAGDQPRRAGAYVVAGAHAAGGTLRDIDDADWDDLPDLGPAFTADAAWRHELARLDQPS